MAPCTVQCLCQYILSIWPPSLYNVIICTLFMTSLFVQCYIMYCLYKPLLCTMLYYVLSQWAPSLNNVILCSLNGPLFGTMLYYVVSMGSLSVQCYIM